MRLIWLILVAFSVSGLSAQTSVDKTLAGVQNGVDVAPVNVQSVTKDFMITNTVEKKAVIVSVPANPLQEVSVKQDVILLTGKEQFLSNKTNYAPVSGDSLKEIDVPAVDVMPLNKY